MTFTHEETKVVAKLYLQYGIPLDQLPYTKIFEQMTTDFAKQTQKILTLKEFYSALLKLRKAGKLGKLKR